MSRSRWHSERPHLSHFEDINPRPAWVWLATRPAGGGGGKGPPEISQTTGPISKFQSHSIALYVNYPSKVKQFEMEVTDDFTGQVKSRIFGFSGLVTSASKISMLTRAPLGGGLFRAPLSFSCDIF